MNHRRRLALWKGVLGFSMAAMLGIWIFDMAAPRPGFLLSGEAQASRENQIRQQAHQLETEAIRAEAMVANRLWAGDAEQIGPQSLAIATRAAQQSGLKLSAFRPQKPLTEGPLQRFPYLVSLEGTYPRVLAFVRYLETNERRLAVNVVQIASSDGASSAVTATVGIWAIRQAPEAPPTAKGRTTNAT